MDKATLAHVALGCNAASGAFCGNTAAALEQTQTRLCAAFGALNSVALVSKSRDETTQDASSLRIEATLQHRVASTNTNTRITSVYLHASGSQTRVLAGDSDGRVFLWTRKQATQDPWRLLQLPTLSSASVAALTAMHTPERWIYVVSLSDGALVVLAQETEEADVKEVARLELGIKRILESVALITVPAVDKTGKHRVLLAAGGVDNKVYLFELTDGLHELFALEGHRGWIRHVAFEPRPVDCRGSCLLASASQDERIRLWKVSTSPSTADSTASASANGFHALSPDGLTSYTVSFDALLLGHEDWVTSLTWVPSQASGFESEAARLVSTSMDNSLIVWEKDAERGSWSPALRVGDMGGNGLLASAVWTIGSRLDLLALNFSGQLERWTQQQQSTIFLPGLSLSGHCGAVTDVSWSPRGDYLLSVSLDQTARIWAPVLKSHDQLWSEISRAQVHGYDLNCASFLRGQSHNDRFVSGADEKILRIFEAPDEIQRLVQHQEDRKERSQPRVAHAYLPELSLTNKTNDADASTDELGYVPIEYDDKSLVRLPVGDTLARKTLWPELRKLYGHANELLCVTSDHSGSLLASACKSREERFAGVWLWNTNDWSAHQIPLAGHKSSVVQLAFSSDDQRLLSVSKDRHVCVYEKQSHNGEFVLQQSIKAHKRIIWSCSWSPDSKLFATGSRDQTFTLWGRRSSQWTSITSATTMDHAVTAVAFAPWGSSSDSYLLAVGLENGSIHLFTVSATESGVVECKPQQSLDLSICPSASVSRLTWSPDTSSRVLLLTAASADTSVRVFSVQS